MSKKLNFTKKLTESAIMLAMSVVLSYVKLLDLPYGGSITFCSMLPTILISYRHGMGFGFFAGFANGFLQLIMGVNSLSYATSAMAAFAIIVLDYILAFSVTGLGGIFKKAFKNQTTPLVLGTVLICFLRYIFHVISGCTVWAGLSIPNTQALVYSLAYNATYMLPELLIAVAGAFYLGSAIDFDTENLTRNGSKISPGKARTQKSIGAIGGLTAFITDVLLIFSKLQNSQTGEFDITGIQRVNIFAVLGVTLFGAVWFAFFYFFAKKRKQKVDKTN